jgi:SAM-dependent methyltransferase
VEAIDNSSDVVEACRGIPGVTASLADAVTHLRERPAHYDLILLYHVLEHFNRDAVPVLLRAIRLALKSGGVVVIGVPNAAAPIIGADQQYFDFTHQTAFSPWSLEQVLRMSGFERVDIRPVWPPRAGLGRAVQRYLQRSLLAVMRAYLWAFSGVPRPVLTHSMVAYGWR